MIRRRRCLYKFVISVVLCVLILVSVQLSFFSDSTLGLFHRHKGLPWQQLPTNKAISRTVQARRMTVVQEAASPEYTGNPILTASLTWDKLRKHVGKRFLTGNPIIDSYGKNDPLLTGENGRGVTFVGQEKVKAKALQDKYNVNVYASDIIALNRQVPDSRFSECRAVPFPDNLPSTSIILPFYDEWFSVLLRTVYSIINRTPWHLLQEIILVDDGSQLEELKDKLDKYVAKHFPRGLVKIIRMPQRSGLIKARLAGWRESRGDAIVFFDSHMEVNIDWLQPLLVEVSNDRKTVAMGTLDYIDDNTLEYKFYDNYMTRYGFDWRLVFFETFFRNDQLGESVAKTRPGTVMVGAAFAIDSRYFGEMGAYDEGMNVWGGENLEMAWRMWLCGGRLVHVPCSHIGHIARSQPYAFPGGRQAVEEFNYKRAVDVWMEPEYRNIVYHHFPNMKNMSVGDLTARLELKKRLKCKPFSWFLETIWPELFVYHNNVSAWGSARNLNTNKCLDNHQYLFQAAEALYAEPCHYGLATQGFSMTKAKQLRTSLQCVVYKGDKNEQGRPQLEDCIIGLQDQWVHRQGGYIKHVRTGLCLDIDNEGPIMKPCEASSVTQIWQFNTYVDE